MFQLKMLRKYKKDICLFSSVSIQPHETSRVLVRQLRGAEEVVHAPVKRAALPMPEIGLQVMKQLHDLCGWGGSANGIVACVVQSVKVIPNAREALSQRE